MVEIINFIKSFPVRSFQKGETLFGPDDDTPTILIVRDGVVKVSSYNDADNERFLWVAGRYDIIPSENFFASTAKTRFYYTAFCDGTAYAVDKKAFLEVALKDADAMSQIARGLSEHYDDLLSRLNSVEQSNLRSKILMMLNVLCEKFSGADTVHFHELGLNLTHQDIADMVHATREAVSIELNKLKQDNVIDYTRSTFTVFSSEVAKQIETPA